jgi:hypothetical protein
MAYVVVWDNLLWYLPRSPAMLAGPPQHLVGILFPWVLVVPLVAWRVVRAVRAGDRDRDALVFVMAWAGALLLCLGISEQQRLRYYVPLIPPVALGIGWWVARAAAGSRGEPRVPWRVYGVVGAVLAVVTVIAVFIRPTWSTGAHVAFPTSGLEVGTMAAGLTVFVGALVYGIRTERLRALFAVAWIGSAAFVVGGYHWELERRNAAYDYPRVRAEARRLLPESPVVATWGVYDLPLSFYMGRRVASVRTGDDLRRVMAEHPRASAVLTEAALAHAADRGLLHVLPLDRLNFDAIVLVSYQAEPPLPDSRR